MPIEIKPPDSDKQFSLTGFSAIDGNPAKAGVRQTVLVTTEDFSQHL